MQARLTLDIGSMRSEHHEAGCGAALRWQADIAIFVVERLRGTVDVAGFVGIPHLLRFGTRSSSDTRADVLASWFLASQIDAAETLLCPSDVFRFL
jgi:hypothetical protein